MADETTVPTRVELLEAALLEYIRRYGLTENARNAMLCSETEDAAFDSLPTVSGRPVNDPS